MQRSVPCSGPPAELLDAMAARIACCRRWCSLSSAACSPLCSKASPSLRSDCSALRFARYTAPVLSSITIANGARLAASEWAWRSTSDLTQFQENPGRARPVRGQDGEGLSLPLPVGPRYGPPKLANTRRSAEFSRQSFAPCSMRFGTRTRDRWAGWRNSASERNSPSKRIPRPGCRARSTRRCETRAEFPFGTLASRQVNAQLALQLACE